MNAESVIFSIFLIFTGAALMAALALYARQSLLVAYIVLGWLAGPWGLGLVRDADVIEGIGHIGIIFLLYLLGLNLHPQKLLQLLREALTVTAASSLVFAMTGYAIAWSFGFRGTECMLIGAAVMFSSTILGLKLLPATALHHRHTGEVIISVLLLQDILAIFILLLLETLGPAAPSVAAAVVHLGALPLLVLFAFVLENLLLVRLIRRFDAIGEYVFLTAIGWCLGISQLAHWLGLSYETGAFVAGVALASSPVATHIAESLRPLRDFFLIMFFFSMGAGLAIDALPGVLLPALVLAAVVLILKPPVFRWLLVREGERRELAAEVGVRLGQGSEFALLIAALALHREVMGERAAYLVQVYTLLTFIASSYVIMWRYPTPIAVNARLRRD